jgi:hypothetical protein
MAQLRGVEFYGLEKFASADLDAMQDRLFEEFQLRAANLFQADRGVASRESTAQNGVLAGLKVSISAGLTLAIANGEAMIYDSAALAPDSLYRIARVDGTVAGLPNPRTVTLSAADATNPRIDAITVSPATGSMAGESIAVQIKDAITRLVASQTKTVRTRPSATLNVVTGTPGATPAAPATPAGQILLAYAYVPALAVTPTFISDERTFLTPSNLKNMHGVGQGCALKWASNTTLTVRAGTLWLQGEPLKNTADATFTWTNRLTTETNVGTAAGWRYVYAYRKHSVQAAAGSAPFDVIVSLTAPSADGTPSAAFTAATANNPLGAGLQAECIFLGSFYFTSAVIAQFVRVGSKVMLTTNFTAQQILNNGTFSTQNSANGSTSVTFDLSTFAPATAALIDVDVNVYLNTQPGGSDLVSFFVSGPNPSLPGPGGKAVRSQVWGASVVLVGVLYRATCQPLVGSSFNFGWEGNVSATSLTWKGTIAVTGYYEEIRQLGG